MGGTTAGAASKNKTFAKSGFGSLKDDHVGAVSSFVGKEPMEFYPTN